jgi:hypothetical protein
MLKIKCHPITFLPELPSQVEKTQAVAALCAFG